MKLIPKSFRFSWRISLFAGILAPMMLWASSWQWDRYLYKLDLIEAYKKHDTTEALPLIGLLSGSKEEVLGLVHNKVKLEGQFDLENQVIIINRRHETGSGYWLMAPFKLKGRQEAVWVSRGFIPFADREAETWAKYDLTGDQSFEAVVQESVSKRTFLSPGNPSSKPGEKINKWLYPELPKLSAQVPYPMELGIFVQKLGGPAAGTFPAESITFKVPPSTHFGYTIEWGLLALATVVIAFLVQAFPRRKRKMQASGKLGPRTIQ